MEATLNRENRGSRMDLRMTSSQRKRYEKAAMLKGQSLTQWSLAHLDECAEHDIEQATRTVLSDEAFDAFCEALESPMPQAARDLLARRPIWE